VDPGCTGGNVPASLANLFKYIIYIKQPLSPINRDFRWASTSIWKPAIGIRIAYRPKVENALIANIDATIADMNRSSG
jgi:hypothetical protein